MADFGKEKCAYLKNLRVKIAEANGIDYVPAECHHEGDCPGFCPVCDSEMDYISKALEEKAGRGEQIKLSGLLVDDTKLANYESNLSEDGIEDITMGDFQREETEEEERERAKFEERRRKRNEARKVNVLSQTLGGMVMPPRGDR